MTRTEAYGEFVSLWRVYKKDPTEENRMAASAAYEKYLGIDATN